MLSLLKGWHVEALVSGTRGKLFRGAYLLHGLGLGSRSYSGHRQTHVDGGADTLVEQLSLQEDLEIEPYFA